MTVCIGDLLTGNGCSCDYCRELSRRRRARQPSRANDRTETVPVPDLSWKEDAACKGKPIAWFFPHSHPSREALALCDSCPVKLQCAAYSVDEQHGIWAGQSRDRKRARPERPHVSRRFVTRDREQIIARWRLGKALTEIAEEYGVTLGYLREIIGGGA